MAGRPSLVVCILFAAGAFEVGLLTAMFGFAAGGVAAAASALFGVGGLRYGTDQAFKAMREAMRESLGPLPATVTLTRDEETGHVTALVTTVGGDPRVLDVPDDVAENGPQAAIAWVLRESITED